MNPNDLFNTMMGNITDTMTITSTSPSPTYTVTTSNNTSSGSLYWGLNGTSAIPGQVFTTSGTSTGWVTPDTSLNGATLSVKGNADFEGEVTIKGKNLTDMFEKIEERLAILHPNPELEDKWDELKELGKRYKELEQEIIEKEKVWAILKK
jgi:hypothetical protein